MSTQTKTAFEMGTPYAEIVNTLKTHDRVVITDDSGKSESIIMKDSFSEVKLFQVKPDKIDDFEALVADIADKQKQQQGCLDVKYVKRFYTIDGVELGDPPRELTKIVKCVKYFSYWEFDSKENYGKAVKWFFDSYGNEIQRLLIMPFDINCGYSVY